MLFFSRRYGLIAAGLLAFTNAVFGWDYEGHRLVNQLALASLPPEFPGFVKTPEAAERIAFLSGEPDRWRNTPDLPLKHSSFPEHYMDVEELAEYGMEATRLPVFRYDFVADLALYRKAHADKFQAPTRNEDHTRELVGLLPWAATESYSKLKSGFSYLKAFQAKGTPEEVANAEANIIYVMGVMGHMVGDAGQPLHTTIHHHGWVGENPNHYSTNSRIHSWIDGGYFNKIGGADVAGLKAKLKPAGFVMLGGRAAKPAEMFQAIVDFVVEQNKQVEPLYQMEKAGKLSGNGTVGLEGKVFLEGQLVKSGQLLGNLWYSAWEQATPDNFLLSQLERRAKKPQDN